MKVIIQDLLSQLYLASDGQWTENIFEAKDFGFSVHAHTVAMGCRLESFQILFYFPNINYRIVIHRSDSMSEVGEKVS